MRGHIINPVFHSKIIILTLQDEQLRDTKTKVKVHIIRGMLTNVLTICQQHHSSFVGTFSCDMSSTQTFKTFYCTRTWRIIITSLRSYFTIWGLFLLRFRNGRSSFLLLIFLRISPWGGWLPIGASSLELLFHSGGLVNKILQGLIMVHFHHILNLPI